MTAVMESAEVVVAEHGPFKLTATGVVPMGPASYDEWAAAFSWAQKVEKASQFWIGDLLAYGDHFGEEASQMLEASEYAEKTCANAKYTCTAIPPERRRAAVPYAHHHEVAPLPPADQDYWLKRCEDESLTRDQLRLHLKAAKASQGAVVEYVVTIVLTDADKAQAMVEKFKAEGLKVKLTAHQVTANDDDKE